jgi:cation diffusion facilitator family transporter
MMKSQSSHIDVKRCSTCGSRFSVLNLLVNLALTMIKIVVGILSGSRALLACSLYSFNDVLSAVIVMVSQRMGSRPADQEHAYGYGKAEFVAIAIISFIMVAALFFIIFYSVTDIVRGVEGPPHVAALLVAVLSMIVGELLARMGYCSARHSDDSPSLKSCAEHNRADALSSLAVAVGVGGAILGLHVLDPIVAIFEVLHIGVISGAFFGKAIKGLMDLSLPPDEVERISLACGRVPGVSRVALLRTRRMGIKSCVDVVINVSRDISVEQADKVVRQVKSATWKALGRSVETQVRFEADETSGGMEPTRGEIRSHA